MMLLGGPSTSETEVTPNIKALAYGLQNDPARIFEYVRNCIDYSIYHGSRNGATATLLAKRGNDLDQCSLLIALLRAADASTDAHYVEGEVQYSTSFLANLLDVSQDHVLGILNTFYVPASNYQGNIRMTHFWVEATVDGVNRVLDPGFKPYTNIAGLGVASLSATMGYNRATFLSDAMSGASQANPNEVANVNEANVRSDLAQYSTNLVACFRSTYPNASIEQIVSGRKIVAQEYTTLPTSLPYAQQILSQTSRSSLPDTHFAKLTIEHPPPSSFTNTFKAYEIAGKRVSIFYTGADNRPQLRVDGQLIKEGNNPVTTGTYFQVKLTVSIPTADGPDSKYKYLTLIATNRYVIAQDFGSTSPEMIAGQNDALTKAREAGGSQSSEEVLGGALNVMALTWFHEKYLYRRLAGALHGMAWVNHYGAGAMAQEEGYYIDVPLAFSAIGEKTGDGSGQSAWFLHSVCMASAFEHGMLEQMQGTDKPAASTMKLLQLSNSNGKTNYMVTGAYWSAVTNKLKNYTSDELAVIAVYVTNLACTVVLPEDANIALAEWTGLGYVAYSSSLGAMIISGGYSGGYGGTPAQIIYDPIQQNIVASISSQDTAENLHVSDEPVDLFSGDYLFEHTDLSLGSREPSGLDFTRLYSSGNGLRRGPLGWGWTHNYDIEAVRHSHGDPAMGTRQPVDAASLIAHSIVANDLLKNELNIKGWMATVLATKWAMDQLTDNAVTIRQGNRSTEYVKLADGSYNPPPGVTTKLVATDPTNGTYQLQERFGTRMEFQSCNVTGRLQGAQWHHLISVEGEHYDSMIPRSQHYWSNVLTSATDTSGGAYSEAGPNNGANINTGIETTAPELVYNILCTEAGVHRLWIRGSGTNSGANSCHAGLDGSVDFVYVDFASDGTWDWQRDQESGQDNVVTLEEPGAHTINVWMREDGFKLDKLVLTTSTNQYSLSDPDLGPDESPLQTLNYCKIKWWEDADSNRMEFVYDGYGNLAWVTDCRGRSLLFDYNYKSNCCLASVSDSSGRSVSYVYGAYTNLTRFTDPEGNQWTYTYGTNHWLTSIKDPLNQVTISNRYDELGCVTSQVSATGYEWKFYISRVRNVEQDPEGGQTIHCFDELGRRTCVQDAYSNRVYTYYDGQNHVTNAMDARGYATIYQYDGAHNVTNLINALSNATAFTYDTQYHVVSVKDPLGHVTGCGYDGEHHLTNVVDALGNATRTTYTADGLPQVITDAKGNQTTFTYDSYGNPATVQRTDGGTVSNSCDSVGNLLSSRDPNGNMSTYAYDKRRLLLKQTDALGYSISNAYNGAGLLVTVRDRKGNLTSNTYTKAYKLAATVYASGAVVSNTYSGRDLLVADRDPLGRTVTNRYDAVSRLTNTTDALGRKTSYSYDPSGNLLTTRDDLGNVVSNQYDALNRIVKATDQLGNDTDYEYDAAGRLVAVVDALGAATEYQYDAAGRRTAILRPGSVVDSFEYDPLGNLLAFVNGEGKMTSFGYDGMSRVVAETNALGYVTSYTYDPVGNCLSRIDAKDQTVNYYYSPVNLLTNLLYPDSSRVGYQYDANRNVTCVTSVSTVVSYAYDIMNRLLSSTTQVSGLTLPVSYQYDLTGNRTNIAYPGGLNVAYVFDAADRIEKVRDWGNRETVYTYDNVDRLTGIDYPSGVDATYTPDAAGRVVGYEYTKGAATLIERTITRNALGHKMLENVAAGLEPMPSTPTVQTRAHDPADRMTNIFAKAAPDSGSGTNSAYACDANGNLTLAPSAVQYSWDYDSRLTNWQSAVGNRQFAYDGTGDRIRRVANGATSYFVVDRASALHNVLMEVATNGAPLRYYVWGANGLLAQIETNGTVYYVHPDELGSTLALTDTNANLVAQYAYGPNGESWGYTGTVQTVYTFIGGHGVYSEGSGLYRMKARYYSSEYKRFLSSDPIGLAGGNNLYLYANANPLFFLDVLGLCADSYYDGPSWGQGGSSGNSGYYDGPVLRAPVNASEQQHWTDMSYGKVPMTQADYVQAQVNGAIMETAVLTVLGGRGPASRATRPLRLPSTDATLAGTRTLGYTTPAGRVFLQPGLSRAEQVAALRHESVHAFLSPRGSGPVATFRQGLGQAAYDNSAFFNATEEIIAQTYASGSLRQGISHAFSGAYAVRGGTVVTPLNYAIEAGGGLTAFGFGSYVIGGGGQ
ncbi:MAG: RHS repeat-associated core domain-containing protein [Verrucomicrobiota bacterium]